MAMDTKMADVCGGYLFISLAMVSSLLVVQLVARRRRSATAAHGDGGRLRLPPGPWQLPVIGSIHHVAGQIPHRALRDLARRHGPVMMLRLGEVPLLVVSSPEAAREVMKTHDTVFATRPLSITMRAATKGGKDIAFAPYGEYWRRVRKIAVTELLSTQRILSFCSVREEEVAAMLRTVAKAAVAGETVEMQSKLTAHVADYTLRAVMGDRRRCKDRDAFLREINRANELATGFNLVDLWPSSRLAGLLFGGAMSTAVGCAEKVCAVLDGIIQERLLEKTRSAGADEEDFLDVLLRIHKEGVLDMDAVKYVIMDILAGGSDTSATLLEWAMAELVLNPKAMQKATAEVRRAFSAAGTVSGGALGELAYLQLVIKEALRLHPPVPLLLPRECQEACQVLGYDVPRGVQLLVNAWAIGRDERYWQAAEEFRPERFEDSAVDFKGGNFELVPFGAGRRMCPGMAFTLANAELTLASLLFHFDWEAAPGAGRELDMSEVFGCTAHRKAQLLLRPILRVPLPTV